METKQKNHPKAGRIHQRQREMENSKEIAASRGEILAKRKEIRQAKGKTLNLVEGNMPKKGKIGQKTKQKEGKAKEKQEAEGKTGSQWKNSKPMEKQQAEGKRIKTEEKISIPNLYRIQRHKTKLKQNISSLQRQFILGQKKLHPASVRTRRIITKEKIGTSRN